MKNCEACEQDKKSVKERKNGWVVCDSCYKLMPKENVHEHHLMNSMLYIDEKAKRIWSRLYKIKLGWERRKQRLKKQGLWEKFCKKHGWSTETTFKENRWSGLCE